MIDLARNPPAIDEDGGHARRHRRSAPRGEDGVLAHLDLLHEGKDAWIADHVRRELHLRQGL